MKRKADDSRADDGPAAAPKKTKTSLSTPEAQKRFRAGLFDKAVLDAHAAEYKASTPYKHAVIHELVDDGLLRAVRDEIRANVHFTPKETDIYRIHQSGDLANLDGLDDASLAKLPSLLALRDALYSDAFRAHVAAITGCGPLSGRKTDMAINVYTPGCFLLCHDDVIGSRRVSYILYLTDPDTPWQPEWGGALRLFPVQELKGSAGQPARTPLPDPVKAIPPAWNQLSFFAVQPGESFHDVEEVYHAATRDQLQRDAGRVRMAISGWFHIPQPGEDGYLDGEEERQARNSSLMQLRGNPAQYDEPRPRPVRVVKPAAAHDDFDEADLDFLLRYMAPTYLTPDALEQICEHFEEQASITLAHLLSDAFAARLRAHVEELERRPLPATAAAIEAASDWRVARPPHKHRYLYQRPSELRAARDESPLTELLDKLLPSRAFRRWLQAATACRVETADVMARRFRRGQDYTLATGHEGRPRLELNLGITPTPGWGDEGEGDEGEGEGEDDGEEPGAEDDDAKAAEDEDAGPAGEAAGEAAAGAGADGAEPKDRDTAPKEHGAECGEDDAAPEENGAAPKENGAAPKENGAEPKENGAAPQEEGAQEAGAAAGEGPHDVGGHEVYMAADDDADADAAIYKSSGGGGGGGGGDDNILFFQAAAWNRLTIVLRDSGTLRFVKYVGRRARGDRWDVSAVFDVEAHDDGDGEAAPPLGESDVEPLVFGASDDDGDSD